MIAPPMADARSGSPLADRLRARIREGGPIPFVEFMEAALYDPEAGFFERHAVGERGEFVTSPHVSPAFGVLVARQLDEMWELLDRPRRFRVVEVGAGDGTLAAQILDFVSPDVERSVDYIAVERSAAARAALAELDVTVATTLADVPAGGKGCLLANELLDDLPFRWLRREVGGVAELHVDVVGEQFALVPRPVTTAALTAWARDLAPGEERVVQEDALAFVDDAATLFDRGYLWFSDYGFAGGRFPREPHGYRGQRVEGDILADPGSRDITAGVDFDAVAERARSAGLTVWGPVRQRDALSALGLDELRERARRRQVEASTAGRGLEAARIFSARQRTSLLADPAGLGDFLVLAAGRGVDLPPTSVRQVG
ncbi:MAG: SAM-dependent methyltransferase [Actinomycetota bacterium]